jgi:hypothetical protein
MKPLSIVLLTASLVVCMRSGIQAAPDAPASVSALGWLEGRWRGPTSDGEELEAIYSSAEGGVILSVTKAFAGDRVLFVEFERFAVEDGAVVLTPFPDGQRAASFRLVEHDAAARRATFESPENDFPRRIVYERVSDDALTILLTGAQAGRETQLRLDLRRR